MFALVEEKKLPVLSIEASVWEEGENIECTLHSNGSFEEVMAAFIRLRDHLNERIAAEGECPFSPRFTGTKHDPETNHGVSLKPEPWRPGCPALPEDEA